MLLSLAVALAACEAALRLFHSRYHDAAEAQREPDEKRIWRPSASSHYRFRHPDTRQLHLVMHNNLGARQHRDFDQESLEGAVNLAFFGDSFTENLRLPVQYSFHAVLDFLLNATTEANAQPSRRFNVLNFGVDGYGTGQQYLLYRGLPPEVKSAVKHVFYVFWPNDINDVRRNGIYSLDDHGRLVEHIPRKTPLWIRALARAHLTYAVLDGTERLRREWRERFPREDEARETLGQDAGGVPATGRRERDLRVWGSVVRRWQREVERAGGSLTMVDLPNTKGRANGSGNRPDDRVDAGRTLSSLRESVETFSLSACFADAVGDPPPRRMLRFEKNFHWNEAANMVAAHCLYRLVAKRLGLPPVSDEALARQRHRYYRAFADAPDWEGGRYMPEPPWVLPDELSPSAARAIVEKYLALQMSPGRLAEHWRRVVQSAKADGVLARGGWDVYAAWDQRLLVYTKQPCRDEDLRPVFFLRVWPTQPASGWRGLIGRSIVNEQAEYAEITRFFTIKETGDECVVGVALPNFAFSIARTGQFVRPVAEDGISRRKNVWSVELPLREYAY